MKRIAIAIVALCLFTVTALAQMKPEKGDKGFMFNLNGLANIGLNSFQDSPLDGLPINSPVSVNGQLVNDLDALLPQDMLFFRYYVDADKVLRVALGVGFMDRTATMDPVGVDFSRDELSLWSASVGVGYEQHYASNARRIDPYGGLQLNFGYFSTINGVEERVTSTSGNEVETVREFTLPGGWRVQLQLIGGINYFITDNLSIGGEFSFGPMYTQTEGDWTVDQITSVTPPGQSTTTNTETFTGTAGIQELKVAMGGATGFNISLFF